MSVGKMHAVVVLLLCFESYAIAQSHIKEYGIVKQSDERYEFNYIIKDREYIMINLNEHSVLGSPKNLKMINYSNYKNYLKLINTKGEYVDAVDFFSDQLPELHTCTFVFKRDQKVHIKSIEWIDPISNIKELITVKL